MEISIHRADLSEIAAAYAIVSEYYAAARVVARDTLEQFSGEYFAPNAGVFLAWDRDVVLGCVALREIDPSGVAEIKRLYVRPAWRGHGIAQQLLAQAESFAKRAGYQSIYLDTAADMPVAARLYERNGYQRCERYNDNPQAALFMKKDL